MTCSNRDNNRCRLGFFGGSVTDAHCEHCTDYDGPMRGAGDFVHVAIRVSGIEALVGRKPCRACAERRANLNRTIPFTKG